MIEKGKWREDEGRVGRRESEKDRERWSGWKERKI